MFASELLLQVVEESKLPECSSSHLHHWSPVPMSASQTGWMLSSCCPSQTSSFCVLSKTATILDLHKLHTVTRTAEEGEFYDMENMHTHTTTQQPHSTSHHTQKPERKNKKASANFTNCSF
jgi:hypothetical protein